MKKTVLIAALVLISVQMVTAGNKISLRPKVKIQKSLSDKFSLQLEQEARYSPTFSDWEQFNTTLGGEYSFAKGWNTGVAYSWRYSHIIKNDIYSSRNRYYLFLKYKYAIGDWNFSIREKFQSTYYNKTKEGTSYSPRNVLLTKVEVAYKIKPIQLSPYISGTLRYAVNHPTKNQINEYRWAVGTQYKINKLLGVDVFFEQRGDMNVDRPGKVRIIGTALKFNI